MLRTTDFDADYVHTVDGEHDTAVYVVKNGNIFPILPYVKEG